MKSFLLALICAIVALSGCSANSAGKIFRYDIPEPVENFDPQLTTSSTARMILGNFMEGLVVQGEGGEVRPGVAESYAVSDDSMTYTFHIRPNAVWSNGASVTADDFAFAFQRLFEYGSPLAERFSAIRGASAVLRGEIPVRELGIRAENDRLLVIELEHPDLQFLERLCDPAAFPCNETFFLETRGRYGLQRSSILSNGPFALTRWDNSSRIELRTNEKYSSELPVVAGGVNFYIGRNASTQFQDGKTDAALLSYDQQARLEPSRTEITPIVKTVWCIVFNLKHPIWRNPLLRQGLARTVDHQSLGEGLPIGFTPSSVLIPDAMRIMGRPYRQSDFDESPLSFNTREGQRLFRLGLSALGRDQLPDNSAIIIPQFAADSLNIGELQQGWQKYLSAYLKFSVESPEKIQNLFRSGNYQALVMPFTPASFEISSLLEAFTSDNPQNYFGYQNPVYDELLLDAAARQQPESAARAYEQAESLLLFDAVIIPLYFETTYFCVSGSVQDLMASPFGDMIYFKYAQKNN